MSRLALIGAGLLLAVAPGTCAPPAPDVTLFGDSNVAFARDDVEARTDLLIDYQAEPGAQIDDWIDEMEDVPAGRPVVVALGSNDILVDEGAAWTDIGLALTALGPGRCIVWVQPTPTTFFLLGEPYSTAAELFNDTLWSSVEHVVVWDTDQLQPDHIHFTSYGAYADTLVEALETCP